MQSTSVPNAHTEFSALSKAELRRLADGLLQPDPWVIERCVEFVLAETQGVWHGRARAMMCRRLKHCALGPTHHKQLFSCITGRLVGGFFSEQFKDQLRLAMHIDLAQVVEVCRGCLLSPKHHVRRYAEWILSHEQVHNEP